MKMALSRRQFLAATGAIFALPALSTVPTLAQSSIESQSGALALHLPASKVYPQLSKELLAGLASVISANSFREIGANELKNLDGFSSLISYDSPSSAALLRHRLAENPVQIIAADLGMDIQRFREKLPRLTYLSLNVWQASQALALWTRENIGSNLAIVADRYETGYDSFSIFQAAFPEAKIVLFDEDPSLSTLEQGSFDALAFALHGQRAEDFVRSYERSGMTASLIRLPFVGNAISSRIPSYSASLAMNATPFFALGRTLGLSLLGEAKTQNDILIKRGTVTIESISPKNLPYHGLSNAFKTGWTNPYLV